MSVTQPVLNLAGSGKSSENENGTRAEIAVDGHQSNGDYAVVRYHVKPGDEPPLHTHTREDELVYVESGEITAIVGDNQIDVGPGAIAALPQGIPHTIRVRSESATLILTLMPAGIERFFVPETDADQDPASFGLKIHEPVASD